MAWVLDKPHSVVEFAVKHMMITTVKGRFTDFDATLNLDEQTPTNSSFEVTINIASISTGEPNRDNHLRSADFFDVEHFPTATYRSTSIEALGDDRYRVNGDLTLKGETHPQTLEISFEGEATHMQGHRLGAFSGHGALNRKDWGLNWNVALEKGGWLVGEKVTLNIEAEVAEKVEAAAQ